MAATFDILTPGQCRAAREALDWTQERLAGEAGLSKATVRSLEQGAWPASRTVASIARALGDAGVELLPGGDVRLREARRA